MPNSRSIELYYADGEPDPRPSVVEVSEPDDDGDIRIEVFVHGKSVALMHGARGCIRELAIVLLEASK
jgi:hypothetical protein